MKSMKEVLENKKREDFATSRGSDIHHQLQFLDLNKDCELARKIKSNQDIMKFFNTNSRAEVPVAGTINGRFYSNRIDRLLKTDSGILFLDYKTDTDKSRLPEYEKTMKIYAELLRAIYPMHAVHGYILWLKNFELEKLI